MQTELDEDILLNIDSLTSRDIKLAIGEEVEEESEEIDTTSEDEELEELESDSEADVNISLDDEVADVAEMPGNSSGVESLKTLLEALTDKNVAASLEGMKININITLGDK